MVILENRKALFSLIIGVIGISFAASFVRWSGVSAGLSAFYRLFYGTLSLFIILTVLSYKNSKFSFIKKLDKRLIKYVFLAGFFLGIDLYLWHIAILKIGSGLATVVANTQVFHTVIIGTLFLGEKLDWRWRLILPIAFFGVGLIAVKDFSMAFDSDFIIGTILAVIAGFLYAVFLYLTKKVRSIYSRIPNIITWFYITFFCFITLLVMNLFTGEITFDIGLRSHLVLFFLGLITTALSWVLISNAMSVLPLIKTSFILLGQPLLATIWGVLFFDEFLSFTQIVGVIITLTMLIYGQFLKIKT